MVKATTSWIKNHTKIIIDGHKPWFLRTKHHIPSCTIIIDHHRSYIYHRDHRSIIISIDCQRSTILLWYIIIIIDELIVEQSAFGEITAELRQVEIRHLGNRALGLTRVFSLKKKTYSWDGQGVWGVAELDDWDDFGWVLNDFGW